MRKSLRRTLLWQGIGFLLYLGGMGLFLLVAVGVFLGPPENSFANVTTGDTAMLLLSMVLIITGRVIHWKRGGETGTMTGSVSQIGGREPDRSKLEELGYRMPPEESDDADVVYEDGEIYSRCSECGAKNEQTFDYCNNCSSRLPE